MVEGITKTENLELNLISQGFMEWDSYINENWETLDEKWGEEISALTGASIKPGFILPCGLANAPTGWLKCDGSAVSRTDYAALFSAIGSRFGNGDGSKTFNIPNLQNRFPRGASNNTAVGAYLQAGLPNIVGQTRPKDGYLSGAGSDSGALKTTVAKGNSRSGDGGNSGSIYNFNASWSNGIYGRSSTVMPESLSVLYIIKY